MEVAGMVREIYFPKLVRFAVNKDHKHNIPFDLNYRKHLRETYSREHIQVYKLPGMEELMKDYPEFERVIAYGKSLCKRYSEGQIDQPSITFGMGYEYNEIDFIIIKNGVVVETHTFTPETAGDLDDNS
jgi:hypothetical protein